MDGDCSNQEQISHHSSSKEVVRSNLKTIWRHNLEKELAEQLHMGPKGNVFLEETISPGSLEKSFNATLKTYQVHDDDQPEELDEESDPDKLAKVTRDIFPFH